MPVDWIVFGLALIGAFLFSGGSWLLKKFDEWMKGWD